MPINRREFLRLAGGTTIAVGLGGAMAGYAAVLEPNNLVVERKQVCLPRLPNAFDGFRIVLLTDLHLHPFTTSRLVRRTVEMSNALKPHLVLLGGDFVCSDAEAVFELASILEGRDGKHVLFVVFGNQVQHEG